MSIKTVHTKTARPRALGLFLLVCIGCSILGYSANTLSTNFLSLHNLVPNRDAQSTDRRSFQPNLDHPSVLVITKHQGTLNDFIYVANQLGLDMTTTTSWPDSLTKQYRIDKARALSAWERLGPLYCKHYDYIIVMDTIALGGRPIMEGFLQDPSLISTCRVKRVVFLVTNRFDYGNKLEEYYSTVRQVMASKELSSKFLWAQNNEFESFYIKMRGIQLPAGQDPLLTLRPHGITPTDFPYSPGPPEDLKKVMVVIKDDNSYPSAVNATIIPALKRLNIPYISILGHHYGGPKNLANFKAVFFWPYQVSFMSFYEALSAGAVLIFPSPKLLSSWCNPGPLQVDGFSPMAGWFPSAACRPDLNCVQSNYIIPNFPFNLVEYYGDYFKDVVLTVDDVDEIPVLLNDVEGLAALRARIDLFMKQHHAHVLQQWSNIFFDSSTITQNLY